MFLPHPQDAVHKAWQYRLLTAIVDDEIFRQRFCFKGGTCAAMLGYLNRFSIDLDFDYIGEQSQVTTIRGRLFQLFADLNLKVDDFSKTGLQFFLKYEAQPGQRNTLKLEAQFPPPQTNEYRASYIADIDRTVLCQTRETMFANKLVALMDRFERHHSLAGRDVYDIHQFFLRGYQYNTKVIEERRGQSVQNFFEELLLFIEEQVTQTIIEQDINMLVEKKEFQQIRKSLKNETLLFVRDELKRIKKSSM